jgi:hypothetical protein
MTLAVKIKQTFHEYWIVLAAPFFLLAPLLLTGKVLFWGTPSLQFIPWWSFALSSLGQGSLPLWNPLNGMGAPLIANYQSAFFYPPNWLLLAAGWVGGSAGIAFGFTLLAGLHLAWAGLGMAFLLRRLEFPWLAQTIGGLAFGLSGYLVARLGFFSMVWVGAWLPWAVYFAHGIASSSAKVQLSPGLVISIAMQLLAGHAQLTWYSLLLCAAWITAVVLTAQSPRRLLTAWTSLFLAAVFSMGIAAVQLVPTFEYLRASQRANAFAYDEALTYSFWPWRIITMLSPDFFGSPATSDYWGYASYWEDHIYQGVLPFLLALGGIFAALRRRQRGTSKPRRFLVGGCLALILFSFALAFGKNTPIFPFLYWNIPTFNMFQAPTRYLILVAFALPILAAVGIERWRCPTGKGLYWFRLGTAGAFAVSIGAGLAWLFLENIRLTFIRSTAVTGFWGLCFGLITLALPLVEKKGWVPFWRAVVLLVAFSDLLLAGWALNPGVALEFYSSSPPGIDLLAQGGRIYLAPKTEYDLKFRRFFRFKDFQPLENWFGVRQVILPDSNLLDRVSLMSNFDPLVSERYQGWKQALADMPANFRPAWQAFSGAAYEERIDLREPGGVRFDRLENAQRWHWFSCATQAKSPAAALLALQEDFTAPPRADRRVILENGVGDAGKVCQPGPPAQVSLVSEKPDQVVLRVVTDSAGWLELMDSWYPGWKVSISGEPAALLPADYQFRAVYVEPGTHTVIFSYRPTGFYFAALFSILVLLLGMFLVLIDRRSIQGRT